MLGNFSFGDYFKEHAIEMAGLLTKNYQIDREKLYVTVYHTDDEAFNIWKKVTGFSESKILVSTSDNFWEMGDLDHVVHAQKYFLIMVQNFQEDFRK